MTVTGHRLQKIKETMEIATDFNSIPHLETVMNALLIELRSRNTVDEVWKSLPWRTWSRQVWRIQRGIYKAARQNDNRRVLWLQRLLLRSRAAQALSVRQVTQLNTGKKTPGVDGKTARDTNERLRLCQRLRQHWHDWEHRKLKRVNIPNCEATAQGVPDGRTRLLGIPTIADRAWQALMKLALEPVYEAKASPNSYGFRPGRGAWDAQTQIFNQLRSESNGFNKWVLELDIQGCFDNINHRAIMGKVQLPRPAREGIRRAIKAGVKGETPSETKGTPQGSVISPLLANLAIGNLEDIAAEYRKKGDNFKNLGIPGIRYATDLVYITKTKKEAEQLLVKVTEYLSERGLRIKEAKTRITKATQGFDFLGWHFRVKANGKLTVTPCRKCTEATKTDVKETMKSSDIKLEGRLDLIASKIRGWRNYHKWCDMSKHSLWHLNQWVKRKIRKELGKAAGLAAKKLKSRLRRNLEIESTSNIRKREAAVQLVKQAFPKVETKIFGHVKVKFDKSPLDGDLVYWTRRNYKQYSAKSWTGKAIQKQGYKCAHCHMPLMPGDDVELHHIDGNHANNLPRNHVALHRACHQHPCVHRLSRSSGKSTDREELTNHVAGGAV